MQTIEEYDEFCTDRDYKSVCPEGWTVISSTSTNIAPATEEGYAPCLWEDGSRVQCAAPKSYTGPCRQIESPPCDVAERRLDWTEVCNIKWPCAQRCETCKWGSCKAPNCKYSGSADVNCADHSKTAYLTIVVQFPENCKKFKVSRRLEFLHTLYCNLRNPIVKRVVALQQLDGREPTSDNVFRNCIEKNVNNGTGCGDTYSPLELDPCNKLHIVSHESRLLYGDAFKYANSAEPGMYIITNGDIAVGAWPNETIVDSLLGNNMVMPITRQELEECINWRHGTYGVCDCRTTNGDCMDSFLVRSPSPDLIVESTTYEGQDANLNFWLGAVQGGENIFMEMTRYNGIALQNRCGRLPLYHNHCSFQRVGKSYTRYMGRERLPLGPVHIFTRALIKIGYKDNWSHAWRKVPPVREGLAINNTNAVTLRD